MKACKPLICLVPEAGIEPARPYERGILSHLTRRQHTKAVER